MVNATNHDDCDCAYVFLGAPGAGKGSVCKWLMRHHGWGHLECGQRFRDLVASAPQSEEARQIAPYLSTGELVPDAIVMHYVDAWLDDCNLRLFDGVPRTLAQCGILDRLLARRGRAIKQAFFIEVTPDDLKARLVKRKTCAGCGAIWNDLTRPSRLPGICDDCGGQLVARADDTPELIDHRLAIFARQFGPVLDYYSRQGKLRTIRYTNDMSVDELFAAVEASLLAPACCLTRPA